MINLVLFIPGFLSPKVGWAEADSAVDIALPALELLLVRASHTREAIGEGSYEAALCKLFGIEPKAHGDLPIAALTHLVDFEGDHAGVWIRADPVYLRPDLGKLLLFDSSAFHIEKEEAETLIREINPILGQQGRPLSFGKGWTRWYLRLPRAPRIETYPPSTVTGQHIDPYIPAGPERRDWHRLFNETQMLLHSAKVNQAREARGEPPINSVWFWGSGALPATPKVHWTKVWSSEPLAQALAKFCGCPYAVPTAVRDCLEEETAGGDILVVLHKAQCLSDDSSRWYEYIMDLERDWFAPSLENLKAGRLASLTILTARGSFTVTRSRLRRFWLRRKGIGVYHTLRDVP
jgi:hypothetical protein